MSEYTDEAFADALRTLKAAIKSLEEVDRSIDANEELRDRIAAELGLLTRVLASLESLFDEASQELL